jgi:hypothetical protein
MTVLWTGGMGVGRKGIEESGVFLPEILAQPMLAGQTHDFAMDDHWERDSS